jgi:hypothetical protein
VIARANSASAALCFLALVCGLAPAAHALPPPEPPRGRPTVTPSAAPTNALVLPSGSPIDFVLEDSMSSSKSREGQTIRMRLRNALIVNGVVLAKAETPATLKIGSVHRAAAGNNDGSLQIAIQPLELENHKTLPIRANHEYLTVEHTGGQLATRATTDTITDIFVPGAVLFNALRKGRDFVLPPGAILRAQTAATIDATDPKAIAIVIPHPAVLSSDQPHSDFTPAPMFTPIPVPTKKPKATPKPTAAPTAAPAEPAPTGTS